MAIVELQFREEAFGELLKRQVDGRRLSSPTAPVGPAPPGQPPTDKLVDRITCDTCEVVEFDTGKVTARLGLLIRYYDSYAVAQAAGSLKQPATLVATVAVPLTLEVIIRPTPKGPKPVLAYSSVLADLIDPGEVALGGLGDFGAQKGAIYVKNGVVVVRIASDLADPLDGTVVNRVPPGADWTLIVPGGLIAEPFIKGLDAAIADLAKSDPSHVPGAPASGAYLTTQELGLPPPPLVLASAEVVAVEACPLLGINVSVAITTVGTFVANGPNIETTLTLTWSADSTWCQIAGFFTLTPISSLVIAQVAASQAKDAVLGSAGPTGFKEIGRDDHSITYLQKRFLDIPGLLALTSSQFTDAGLVLAGGLPPRQQLSGLQGWSEPPSSGFHVDCTARAVSVKFSPAVVGLFDYDPPGGAPKLFAQSTVFIPPKAWVVAPRTSNSSLDLELTFADPPGGRLPPGTATSVFLMTDCGLRWVDLGVIPADHPPPSIGDTAQMLSQCMARSAGWKARVLSVTWLPRPPEDARGLDPVRQWMLGFEDMAPGTRLEFVAVSARGEERSIGVLEGRSSGALHLTTDANETLEVRSNRDDNRLPTVAAQRWLRPFASLRLEEPPVAIAASGGLLAVRNADGVASAVEIGPDRTLLMRRLDGGGEVGGASVDRLGEALDREGRHGRSPWNGVAQIDSRTVAVVHEGSILVGAAGEAQIL
ncbi:MAG: hypothetical protein JWQ97_1975 [Phenylobacterium sp.]|nr:hypothetical protein [Phenylobacterium sp.]